MHSQPARSAQTSPLCVASGVLYICSADIKCWRDVMRSAPASSYSDIAVTRPSGAQKHHNGLDGSHKALGASAFNGFLPFHQQLSSYLQHRVHQVGWAWIFNVYFSTLKPSSRRCDAVMGMTMRPVEMCSWDGCQFLLRHFPSPALYADPCLHIYWECSGGQTGRPHNSVNKLEH